MKRKTFFCGYNAMQEYTTSKTKRTKELEHRILHPAIPISAPPTGKGLEANACFKKFLRYCREMESVFGMSG
jgi:hypothetical protein